MLKTAGDVEKSRREQVIYRLHALLHTMRSIEHHEERLCSIMNEIKTKGELPEAVRRELDDLLHELPTQVYQTDLEMTFAALDEAELRGAKQGGGKKTTPQRSKTLPKPGVSR